MFNQAFHSVLIVYSAQMTCPCSFTNAKTKMKVKILILNMDIKTFYGNTAHRYSGSIGEAGAFNR